MSAKLRRWTLTALVAAALVLPACSGATRFVHPEADMLYYRKVGVVPFTSLAQDRLAGEKVTNVFFAELLRANFDDVVEPGQFAAAMNRVRGGTPAANPWSGADLAKLGEETGAQGIFLGTVRDYETTSAGRTPYPLVSLEVRLVDAATGRLVWSASKTRRGGPKLPIVGREIRTLGELTAAVCREILRTLPRG